jgi:hypothetical protein
MTITSEYYTVTVNTYPFEPRGEKEVGCYSNRDLAERVAKFVRVAFEQPVSNFDIRIHNFQGEMVETSLGIRLKETPNGAITLVHTVWSEEEQMRILQFTPKLLKLKVVPTATLEVPKFVCQGQYHCVVLDFYPFEKSRRLFVGYYKTLEIAKDVSDYIKGTHYQKKVGFGMNMSIETYEGEFIQYESGKLAITADVEHEIRSVVNSYEFIRISKVVNNAIIK